MAWSERWEEEVLELGCFGRVVMGDDEISHKSVEVQLSEYESEGIQN